MAQTQTAYHTAVNEVFQSLDRIEAQLRSTSHPIDQAVTNNTTLLPTLAGYFHGTPYPTETDIRLFVTIIRFDPVYHHHFKCNLRDIRSGYPAIHRWVRHLYWDWPVEFGNVHHEDGVGFQGTTHFEHIKKHYMGSHDFINPNGIITKGPDKDILGKDEEVESVRWALETAKSNM